jgi:syndecan 4
MNKCNNRGTCVNGSCKCDSGYDYFDCSVQVTECPNNCRNRGECIEGRCKCEHKFDGVDCGIIKCKDNCSNNGKCNVIIKYDY